MSDKAGDSLSYIEYDPEGFHYNNIGSTMMLTDENGNVNEEYSYGPYGELLSGDASKLIGQNMLNMLQNECNREG